MTIFEVWAVDVHGHRYFIDSTHNKAEASRLAKKSLSEEFPSSMIMQEVSEEETLIVDQFFVDF
jgi:hypothetical protein